MFELSLDDENEKIITATIRETNNFHVIRPDLRHPVTAEIFWSEGQDPLLTVIHRGEKRPHISLQVGRNHYIFDYRPNPRYYLNFAFYPLAYLAVLLFALLIRRQYRNQLDREQETKQKITELQLSLVKNQLDPHFSLNALNAVMSAARNQQFDVVEQGLIRFAGLHRNLLLSAGATRQTLREELDFTENYIELERLRFDGNFEYRIMVEPEVDQDIPVPKMVIQLHAENAVKHGLLPLKQGGKLIIRIGVSDKKLVMVVRDNGVGRTHPTNKKTISGEEPEWPAPSKQSKEAPTEEFHGNYFGLGDKFGGSGDAISQSGRFSDQSDQSTGRGLALMEEFYDLYRKFYHQTIVSEIVDLVDADGNNAGTSVTITIHLSNEYQQP